MEMLSPIATSDAAKQPASGAIDRRSPTGSEAICLTVPCPSTRPVNMVSRLECNESALFECRRSPSSLEKRCLRSLHGDFTRSRRDCTLAVQRFRTAAISRCASQISVRPARGQGHASQLRSLVCLGIVTCGQSHRLSIRRSSAANLRGDTRDDAKPMRAQ